MLPQGSHIDEGLAAVVVAAEEEHLRGWLDLAWLRLWLLPKIIRLFIQGTKLTKI